MSAKSRQFCLSLNVSMVLGYVWLQFKAGGEYVLVLNSIGLLNFVHTSKADMTF